MIGKEVVRKSNGEFLGRVVSNDYNKLTIYNENTGNEIQLQKWEVKESEKIHIF